MPALTSPASRALRDGLTVIGLLFAAYLFVIVAPRQGTFGFDAFAYWSVDGGNPYQGGVGGLGAFNYAPPIARLFDGFGSLDWITFLWLWLASLVGTILWLGRRSRRVIYILAIPPVAVELYHGNVHLLIAAAIVLGFRHPWMWAFVALTKVTPVIGLIWFAVRREWRELGIAVLVIAAIVGVSFTIDAALWEDWLNYLAATPDGGSIDQTRVPIPLLVRLPIAVVIVTWGAMTDRPWTVPVAATVALPVLWFSGIAICAALFAIGRPEHKGRNL